MTDSEVAVESERKNPFTIIGFSVGKLLYVESISEKKPNQFASKRLVPLASALRT
jgi:hypothetical protein